MPEKEPQIIKKRKSGGVGQIVYDSDLDREFVREVLETAEMPLATMATEPNGECELPYLRVGTKRHIGRAAIVERIDELRPERSSFHQEQSP